MGDGVADASRLGRMGDAAGEAGVGARGLEGDDMIDLYHATSSSAAAKIRATGPDLARARPDTDFGRGFYTSTDAAQALRYARTKFRESGESIDLIHFRVSRQSFDAMNVRRFKTVDDQWRSFVRGNRLTPSTHGFDVVEGPILANPDAVAVGAAPRGFGHQVSFHTAGAIDVLMRGIQ
jgi:hypothetical protein